MLSKTLQRVAGVTTTATVPRQGGGGQRPRNELLYASATAIDFDLVRLHDRDALFSTAQAVLIKETTTPAAGYHPCVAKQKTTLPLAV